MASCLKEYKPYKIIGYRGRQVRDNIHADDLVDAFLAFASKPNPGSVYNMGGRGLDCSVLEALAAMLERLCPDRDSEDASKYQFERVDEPRRGDHKWWISDSRKFRREYGWAPKRSLDSIFEELCMNGDERL
jgi:CDP-paratose 2-epimerase